MFWHIHWFLLEPPLFVRSLEPKDVVKGSEMMLEGQVSGSAPFSVSFYKNTKPVRNDKRHRITVKDDLIALQVLVVEAGDVGLYQCIVENEVGRASCDCQVTLKGWCRYRQLFCCHFKKLHFRSAPYLYLDSLAKLAPSSLFASSDVAMLSRHLLGAALFLLGLNGYINKSSTFFI